MANLGHALSAPERLRLAEFARVHGPSLRRYLKARLSDPAARDDVEQDVFLRLARYRAIDSIDNPEAFIIQTAANLIRDRERARARRQETATRSIEDVVLTDPAPRADTVVLDREALDMLLRAIADLPPRRRAAFLLSRVDGLSYREIAVRLGISEKAVEHSISAALKTCREKLGWRVQRTSTQHDGKTK